MTKHASIPWEVAHYEGGLLEGVNVIRQVSSKKDICTLGLPTEEDEANGAFIVRAVNSHEEILQALKVAMKALQYWGDKAETYEKANDPVRLNAHGIVNEAIAKAQGNSHE